MATIKDVASRAQVAKSTVSYAFNKPHLVKTETLERILQVAQELNYQPNVFAQRLAGGKTQMIGLLVPDIRYPFNATIARGIEDRLRKAGYIVIVTSTDGQPEEIIKLMGQLRGRGVSGFILVPSFYGISPELRQALLALRASNVPVVIAGYRIDDSRIDQVTYRPQAGTREAIDHLVKLGHREIAYIGNRDTETAAKDRILGYQEGLLQHHLPLRQELIIETDVTPAQIKDAMAQLMALPQPPTAVFALNDVVAYAVLDYCYEHQIFVPENLSLVSFDYQALVQRITPGITGVVVPVYEVGQIAANLLLERFKQPEGPCRHPDLPYQFVVRETTAKLE